MVNKVVYITIQSQYFIMFCERFDQEPDTIVTMLIIRCR